MLKGMLILGVFLCLVGSANASTIYVPDDYPTIQDAINAAVNGDTVIVRPGTYVENIDFIGKAIHLKSERGPSVTTIDGNQMGSVVTFKNGEDEFSVLEGFTVTNGLAHGGGGILCNYFSSPTITNNTISDNTANDMGGGIYCYYYSIPTITNNTISGNSANNMGGGISCNYYSSLTITNNTITNNLASGGGGISCDHDSHVTIFNTILWSNSAPNGPEIYIGQTSYPSTVTISHSDVHGGQSSIYVSPGCTLNWCAGMIDAYPQFADPPNGDFHLTLFSPCRDNGDNSAVTEPTDFEGDPRIAAGTVDMGADEFYYHLYHIGDVIPEAPIDVKVVGDRTKLVLLGMGSGIQDPPQSTPYGDLYLQMPLASQWSLGVIPANGVLTVSTTVPAWWKPGQVYPFQAIVGPLGNPGTVLTNLMVLEPKVGAVAIYVPDDYPTIQAAIDAARVGDTVIVRPGTYVENIDFVGKAITVKSEQGPSVTIIDGNQSGSVVKFENGESADSILCGFTITNGSGTENINGEKKGGGIYCVQSSPTIMNNIIIGNKCPGHTFSPGNGGGIYCNSSSPTIINNIIARNHATLGGGIFCTGDSLTSPIITNNTLTGNDAHDGGGGFCCVNYCTPVITNTIIWKNICSYSYPEMYIGYYTNPKITYCDVKGGYPGTGNIDADPLWVDPVNDDFHLTWDSPCKNTGDNSALTGLFDFEGDPRIWDGTVDMGADEFHTHLYSIGTVTPGSPIQVKVVGDPGVTPVTLALGSSIQDPPQSTPYGDLYLVLPPLQRFDLGSIPTNGVLVVPAAVPTNWQSGESYPFQALLGPKAPGSVLTNLLCLQVQ